MGARHAREDRPQLLHGASVPAVAVFGLSEFEAPPSAGVDRSLAVRHALVLLVKELAREHPVALVVDDLHWAKAKGGGGASGVRARSRCRR